MTYTPLAEYLPRLVASLRSEPPVPPGYSRRPLELQIAQD